MEDGSALLQLHPKRILSLSRGKFERGTLPLSIKEEMPRFARHDTIKKPFWG